MDEIFERIRSMLAEQLEIDEDRITMDSNIMEDFDADSLDLVDMVMSLEDEFGIEVPDEDVEKFHTVGDVVRFIEANS
ncbi:MAG: acyl carrier protein [Oscillospiraceae bacterium]|nr:acyl carrier protein [Oscillospiraceae bacterium]